MHQHVITVKSVVEHLESIQQRIGESQLLLLDILTDGNLDDWDRPAQSGLLQLELVQRSIGDTQAMLVQAMPVQSALPSAAWAPAPNGHSLVEQEVLIAEDVDEADTWCPAPQERLAELNIQVKAELATTGVDAAADRAARLLGDRYDTLESFFASLKRKVQVPGGMGRFRVDGLAPDALKDILDFGNRLRAIGFLSKFLYLRNGESGDPRSTPVLLFKPMNDPRVSDFFAGGWLERYTYHVVRERLQKASHPAVDRCTVRNVEVEFPDLSRGEFDVLATLPGSRLLWLECKSGVWQDCVDRLQLVKEEYLRLPAHACALILAQPIDEVAKASASEIVGMTVMHFSDLEQWLDATMVL